tara:strand:- start:328 stop:789 length:462 start_codon:yes stop_codon:yes gene_type:complete
MGYTLRDLSTEIQEFIDEFASDAGIGKDDLIASVLSVHSLIEGEDADFALACSYETVRVQVEAAFRRIKKDEDEEGKQLTLDGFEHLCARYIVESESGDRIAINVDRMTGAQLRVKRDQLRAMSATLSAHADEIERYAEGRGFNLSDDDYVNA